MEHNVVEKSGTWFSFGGERIGQGRENARVFLKEHTDIRAKLESALRKKLNIPVPGAQNAVPPAEAEKSAEKPGAKAMTAAAAHGKTGR